MSSLYKIFHIKNDPKQKAKNPLFSKPAAIPLILLLTLVFLVPNIAGAQDEIILGDTVSQPIELDTIVVIGEEIKSERELENPSKFMTVIDVADSPGKVETVSEVLSESVGVQVKDWGGMGSFATVSIRGSSASQVQVYVDGVPVNSTVTGTTNIADLPLDNVEYIEVFRGTTPADFGASGIGGAINLVTRKDHEGKEVSASHGSFDTYKVTATAAGPAGPGRVMVYAGYSQSEGDFEYENDNGTPGTDSDDFEEDRENNDFKSIDLTARGAFPAGNWELTALVNGHSKEQGLPGIQGAQAEETRFSTNRGSLTVSARNRAILKNLDLLIGADGLYENQVLDDPEGELGTGGPRETENITSSTGARIKAVWTPILDLALTGFVEYRLESYLPVEHEPETEEGSTQRRTMLSTVGQAEGTDPSGTVTVQATVRQERYWNDIEGDPNFEWSENAGGNKDTFDLTSPSAGVRVRVNEHFILKANAGRFYRVPTFYEMFGDRGVAVGNTDLKPEVSVNWDAGFVFKGDDLGPVSHPFFEYAYFRSDMEDLILFFQNSQRTVRAVNIGAAYIGGHELSLGFGLFDDFRVSGNYTFQSAIDRGDVPYWEDNALPFRPMHEAYGKILYDPNDKLDVWTDLTYVSGNYWDRANLYEVPDRRIYNAGVTVVPYKKNDVTLAVTLEGKNLADERVSDVAGYPLPGRSFYLTALVKW